MVRRAAASHAGRGREVSTGVLYHAGHPGFPFHFLAITHTGRRIFTFLYSRIDHLGSQMYTCMQFAAGVLRFRPYDGLGPSRGPAQNSLRGGCVMRGWALQLVVFLLAAAALAFGQ